MGTTQPSGRQTISCVIFDIDGTMTETNALIFASFNHVAQKYLRRVYDPSEIVKLFGPPEDGALRRLMPADQVPAAMEDLCTFYRQHHSSMASLHKGIEDILLFLSGKGVRLAVFTGKGRRTTDITLEAFGLRQYFELVITGDDVVRHKPDAEGIRRILETFSVPPDRAVMVGDSMGDITAARGAGVPVATVLWDSYDHARVLEARPDYLFHDAAEMLDWFRGIIH